MHANVAQLVEHNLAKVGVAGSNPVVRSVINCLPAGWPSGLGKGLQIPVRGFDSRPGLSTTSYARAIGAVW
jgi:hypothetical protein